MGWLPSCRTRWRSPRERERGRGTAGWIGLLVMGGRLLAGTETEGEAESDAVEDLLLDEGALAELLEMSVPSVWTTTGAVRVGGGYRDNVLLSSVNPVAAGLVSAGGDFLLSRLPTDGTEVSVMVSGDYSHFVDATAAEPEAIVLAQGEVKRDLGKRWLAGVRGQYVFLHQVFDVSATEADLTTVTARGHTVLLSPSLRKGWGQGWAVEGALDGSWQYFESPLDPYWEAVPTARFLREFGRRGELGLSYRLSQRWYDGRPPLAADGSELPGELEFTAHELELKGRWTWDEARRWSTQVRLGFVDNQDNGGGYFDYDRYSAGLQMRYRASSWSLRAEVRARWYDYAVQGSDGPGSDLRHKTDLGFNVRGDYRLGRKWTVYAEYDREMTRDTMPVSDYHANGVSLGVELEL